MKMRSLCPGSYAVAKRALEQDDTLFSAEGTATHWVGEQCLLSNGELNPIDFVETSAPNKVFLRENMLYAAKLYVDHVRAILKELGVTEADGTPEKRVDLRWVDKEMFGTVDYHYFHEPTKTVYVWDYKNGFDDVEAGTTPQLPFYALGDYERAERAVCFIVQPNAGGIKGVVYSKQELWNWVLEFRRVAEECRKSDAARTPGVHCKHCPGHIICPEHKAETWSTYQQAKQLMVTNPTADEIADEADAIDLAIELLKQRKKSVDLMAYRMAYTYAHVIPRHKLIKGVSQRKFRNDEEIIAVCELQGVNPYATAKLKSPAQLEKEINVKPFLAESEAPIKLVKQSQRGTAVSSYFQETFKNVKFN